MARPDPRWLRQQYLPPADGMTLESAVMTTYRVNWAFVEEDLLAPALGVRSPVSRLAAFRSEIERRLRECEVSILHDLRAADRDMRLSPQIDPIPVAPRKLHAKVSLLMWTAADRGGAARKHVRVVIGSANLTRPGFRENYEVVAVLDYGERHAGQPEILLDAVRFLREVTSEGRPPRLEAQLTSFERFGRELPAGSQMEDQPWRFVTAADVAPALAEAWRQAGGETPDALMIASPFWPEGDDAGEPVIELVRRFGCPGRVELVCQAAGMVDGRPVPILPRAVPFGLKRDLGCAVVVRPVRDNVGVVAVDADEAGETTEDDTVATPPSATAAVRRELHAKVIAVRGRRQSLLYIGSSNCTRRGLGLRADAGRLTNWEAGLIYRLSPKRSGVIDEVFAFAGPPIEIQLDGQLKTQEPQREADPPAPVFLQEIVGTTREITIHFRPREALPDDLVLLMPDQRDRERLWLLWRQVPAGIVALHRRVALEACALVRPDLTPVTGPAFDPRALSTWVEVRWGGASAIFPVRYDDKDDLPPAPGARRYTESELIDYFVHGREPGDDESGRGPCVSDEETGWTSTEVDTRRILSYFIRRFVEAIPGIEADLERAGHSRPVLNATLTGPTGVVALAEAAVRGLVEGARLGEPAKTPVAVGFQLVEIIAALRRTQSRAPAEEAREVIDRALVRCQALLEDLAGCHPALRQAGFFHYRRVFAEKTS